MNISNLVSSIFSKLRREVHNEKRQRVASDNDLQKQIDDLVNSPSSGGVDITAQEIDTCFELCDTGAEYDEDVLDLTNADFDPDDDSILVLNTDNVRIEGDTLVID